MSFGGGGTAPRVNKKTLSAYIGRTVALVGSVESHMPTAVVLRASVRLLRLWVSAAQLVGDGVLTVLCVCVPQDGGIVNVNPAPGSDYSRFVRRVI